MTKLRSDHQYSVYIYVSQVYQHGQTTSDESIYIMIGAWSTNSKNRKVMQTGNHKPVPHAPPLTFQHTLIGSYKDLPSLCYVSWWH